MIEVKELFPPEFIQAVAGLLLLVVADVVLGVSVAIRQHKFDLKQLADFYGTSIIPNVFAWAAVDVLLRIGAFYHLPAVEQLQQLATDALYAVAFASILAQAISKVGELRGGATPAAK